VSKKVTPRSWGVVDVFNTATDLTRATAWVPTALEVVDAGTVGVRWPPDGETHRCAITVSGWSGVRSAPAGGRAFG
jgi:hypothetical protein